MAKRRFHWGIDDCVMHETDETGATTVTYTNEPGPFGPLLSEKRGSTTSYHHYDAWCHWRSLWAASVFHRMSIG